MKSYVLDDLATDANFSEEDYLAGNLDVAKAVHEGRMPSGRCHFNNFGKKEGRKLRRVSSFQEAKRRKLERIASFLRHDLPHTKSDLAYNFLSDRLKKRFNIVDTENVSSHGYDSNALRLIERHATGIVLDCGAGKKPVYYENVVNFEIAPYDTTDVLGVGEALPFKDDSFDAVVSLAVLEHVKDPFRCAREIVRVLKPGGELYCCVPFLQPLHGYPHHYYNMSHVGLKNLFDEGLQITKQEVCDSTLPIWTLTWFLNSWSAGLSGQTRNAFLDMRVKDLLKSPQELLGRPFVRELSAEKNFELASGTMLHAKKPLHR